MREGTIGVIQSPLQADLDRLIESVVRDLDVTTAAFSLQPNRSLSGLGLSSTPRRLSNLRGASPDGLSAFFRLHKDRPLALTDTRADTRTSAFEEVEAEAVVGYLGLSIGNEEVGPIGALCAVTSKPRSWSSRDRQYLNAVGQTIESLILRELYRLESANASNLASEYDQIISAFALVQAEPTSIHDTTGRLVFANSALTEYLSDDELQSQRVIDMLRDERWSDQALSFRSGSVCCASKLRTPSGYFVCQWSVRAPRLN